MKKLLALLLVLALALSMVACASNTTPSTDTSTDTPSDTSTEETTDTDTEAAAGELVDPYAYSEDDYDIQSEEIYDLVLGEFETIYNEAKAEVVDMDKRFAEMAIAEAKLLESGTFLPLSANGGNYAISRVAPYTASTVLWGGDNDRFHNQLVTTEPITAADRDTLKAMWAELKGTGTWEAECEKWLTENGYTLKDTYAMGYASDPLIAVGRRFKVFIQVLLRREHVEGGIHAEEDHLYLPAQRGKLRDSGIVRAHAYMADRALLLERLGVCIEFPIHDRVELLFLINEVDHAEIYIICSHSLKKV